MGDYSGNRSYGSTSCRKACSAGKEGGKKSTAGKGKNLTKKDPAKQY